MDRIRPGSQQAFSRLGSALGVLALLSAAGAARADAAEDARAAAADAHVKAGVEALRDKHYGVARLRFEQALSLAPLRIDAMLGAGDALIFLGEPELALEHHEQVAMIAPAVAHAWSGIGHACLALADRARSHPRTQARSLERARAAFERARALDPSDESARDGLRFLAARAPQGKSLGPLQWLIGGLLAGLCVLSIAELRARGWPPLRELAWPLGLFAATRLVVFSAFALAPALLAEARVHPYAVLHDEGRFVLDTVAGRWDSNLYADVALHGYRLIVSEGNWATVGQFPLVPVLFRGLAYALDDAHWAALLLPNTALLLACCLLFALLREERGERVARGAVCVLLVHPASLHASVLYAESFALLGLVGLAYALRRGALLSAGAWGVLAGLARINTLAIVPWLLFDFLRDPRRRSWSSLLARLSPALGLLAFMGYLQLTFGDALAYFHAVRGQRIGDAPWLYGLAEAWAALTHPSMLAENTLASGPTPMLLLGMLCMAIYAGSAYGLARERAYGPSLFVGAGVALALSSSLVGQPRYLWILFPAAAWIARAADRPVLRYLLPLASACALFAASLAYARWYFVP